MELIESLNEALNYVEKNLLNEADSEGAAKARATPSKVATANNGHNSVE